MLGVHELPLGLGELAFATEDGAERGRGVRAYPAAAAADACDQRSRLLRVRPRGGQMPFVEREEGERCARDRLRGRTALGLGMLDGANRHRLRLDDLAGEVQRP